MRHGAIGFLALVSITAAVLLIVGITLLGLRPGAAKAGEEVVVFAAPAIKKSLDEAVAAFTAETGTVVLVQYRPSGTLLADLRIAKTGDLFIPADESYITSALKDGLIRERIPLARQSPVLAVRTGNPKGIRGLDDLVRGDVKVGLCNDTASIGKLAQRLLTDLGRWSAVRERVAVFKPAVTDLANDLQVGAVDVAILWDATTRQIPGLEAVTPAEFADRHEQVVAAVISTSVKPAASLALARWLASPEHGNRSMAKFGLTPLPGDAWAARPTMVLYSGSVNKPAIKLSLQEFSDREGVQIDTVYNGCGILCADMRSLLKAPGARVPDAYYACDVCFVPPVADMFPEAVLLTETDILIAVPKGNPKGVRTLVDLARPGMRIGVCNVQQSTLGYMTQKLLEQTNLEKAIMRNAVAQTPTGDLLVAQMVAGDLDAVIVYRVNAVTRAQDLDTLPIAHPAAKAVQPFAVAKDSRYRQLAHRLLDHLRSDPSRYTQAGFTFLSATGTVPSRTVSGAVPPPSVAP